MNFVIMNDRIKNRRSVTLKDLFSRIDVVLPKAAGDIQIKGLADDSRKVIPGDLFVAVPGNILDGRDFISEASSLGASAILTARGKELKAEIPVILAENLKSVVAVIADRFFNQPTAKLKVAGITGTNGKTTASYLLAGIFGRIGERWGRIGTVDYDLGGQILPSGNTTPGSIDLQRYFATMLERGLSGCAVEVSSHALDQGRCEAVRFASATFTNLSQDHLDYHHDMESYFEAKARLFDMAPISVINVDDDYGRRLMKRIHNNHVTYASSQEADLRYTALETNIHGSRLEFEYGGQKKSLDFPLVGWFNHQNAAAAAATAVALGLSLEQAVTGMAHPPPVPGRLQAVKLGQPFRVYIDYAHTPDALEKLLLSLRKFGPRCLIVVFGCGGDRDRAKRPIMGRVASALADVVYVTSDNPRSEEPGSIIKEIIKGVVNRKKCEMIEDRSQAIKAALSAASKDDVVVIAGKGHEDYQVIGTTKKYFSDFEVARSVLSKLGYAGNG